MQKVVDRLPIPQEDFNNFVIAYLEALPLKEAFKTKGFIIAALNEKYGKGKDWSLLWSRCTSHLKREGQITFRPRGWITATKLELLREKKVAKERYHRWSNQLSHIKRKCGSRVVEADDWESVATHWRSVYHYVKQLGPDEYAEKGDPSELELLVWVAKNGG